MIGLMAALAITASTSETKTVPVAFRGEWNATLKDCGTGNNDSRLRITATTLRFYEGAGAVRAAFTQGPFEVLIVADMSGEGTTWLASHQFTLAGDGSYLSTWVDGARFIRYRCPAK